MRSIAPDLFLLPLRQQKKWGCCALLMRFCTTDYAQRCQGQSFRLACPLDKGTGGLKTPGYSKTVLRTESAAACRFYVWSDGCGFCGELMGRAGETPWVARIDENGEVHLPSPRRTQKKRRAAGLALYQNSSHPHFTTRSVRSPSAAMIRTT